MLLYRVFPYLESAKAGEPGHPLYLHTGQGKGRFDNPHLYLAWYMAAEAVAAIGEVFAAIPTWTESMFAAPYIQGAVRTLGVYQLDDDLPYIDLDDPQRLLELGVRPSQVVERNRPYTQALAARIYTLQRYNGLRWWSFHRPQWRVYCLWDIGPEVAELQPLSTSHVAIVDAAKTLAKPLT